MPEDELDKQNTEEPEQNEESAEINQEDSREQSEKHRTIHLSGMYETWFLDYASYVILERAVPDVFDGLKPVQRRILHAMKDLDDGRFNKVANIIGNTMQYHPHGDASIGDALVQIGQKDLLVDTQGNWGNIHTGDSAAASRYIEARLSKFALEVLFNPKTTNWKLSYDGRKKEPVNLPVKFPLLLAQGVEGIAVGLASKILPHNFNELIDASINVLKEKDFEIYPDFPTGGLIDVARYNDGLRGGKIRVRAKIRKEDKKTLVISELPYGVNTGSLIDSIVSANDKRKIKIRKIDDNTAANVEIVVQLAAGVSPDQTIDALYAFTNCEVSISPNSCIIQEGKPKFIGVKEILRLSVESTVQLLKTELEIRQEELLEQLHFLSLEKIFIEERIYRKIENCKTWASVIDTIDKGLEPFKKKFYRKVTKEDIERLTEIKIKRISKFNSEKADEQRLAIEAELDEVKNHLANLIEFAINYYRQIKKKYGKGRERKSEIRNFESIEATMVAAASQKLYINRKEGFAGTSLKKEEYVGECSDIDDIIVFRADGSMLVTKVDNKFFVGKDVIYISVFKKNDDRTIYNMIYRDGRRGNYYVKRFPVKGITRDKKYILTKKNDGSRIVYFTANPNGEAESIKIFLRPKERLKKTSIEFDFSDLAIKGRGSVGNIISRNAIKNIVKKEEGVSTLGARDIWFDDTVNRLNSDERGKYLGAFIGDDKILTINSSGHYHLYNYDLSTHFDEDMMLIEKFDPRKHVTVLYKDGSSGWLYIKRFRIEESDKKTSFLNEQSDTELLVFTQDRYPRIKLFFEDRKDGKPRENEIIELHEFIALKGYKAKGKRLTDKKLKKYQMIDPLPYEEPGEEAAEEAVEEIAEETEDNGVGEDLNDKTTEIPEDLNNEDPKEKDISEKEESKATEIKEEKEKKEKKVKKRASNKDTEQKDPTEDKPEEDPEGDSGQITLF